MTPLLHATGLTAGYGRITALRGVDLTIHPGEAVAVIGPNGAGKTTLLNTLAGLHPASSGSIHLDGTDITRTRPDRRTRAGIALIPEGRHVFAALTVEDNLLLGAYTRRPAERRTLLEEIYTLLPVLTGRRSQPAGTLSGGEQQLLALGRALASRPRLILADEPSLGLSPIAIGHTFTALADITATGRALLLVEQNTTAAFRITHRGHLLDRGQITTSGTTTDLAADPLLRHTFLPAATGHVTGKRNPSDPPPVDVTHT